MIRHLVARCLIAFFGYIGAVSAASLFFVFAVAALDWESTWPDAAIEVSAALIFLAFAAMVFAGPLALPGAFAAILLAEIAGLRSWLYFALAGALVAWTGMLAFESAEGTAVPSDLTHVLLASGLVGGLVYWALSGRRSGEGLSRPPGRDERA